MVAATMVNMLILWVIGNISPGGRPLSNPQWDSLSHWGLSCICKNVACGDPLGFSKRRAQGGRRRRRVVMSQPPPVKSPRSPKARTAILLGVTQRAPSGRVAALHALKL